MSAETKTTGGLGRGRAFILVGLMFGMLLGAIDQSIVSTALPTIVGDLGNANKLSWVVTAYLVTVTVTTPLYGKLSDLYGRARIYEISITIFLLGSVLSGLAGDIPGLTQYVTPMDQLALFRALQGVGAGGLIAMATTILGDIFSPRERGKYMSYMMLIFGAAVIGGPILGGWLTDHYSWRWIFYINVPVGLAAITVIAWKLDLPVPEENHSIDYLGAALLVVAVTSLVLLTTWGGSKYAWDSQQILELAAVTIVFGALFVFQEYRAPEPLFPLSLLRNRTIDGVLVLAFFLGVGMFGGTIYLPVFLQTVLGESATNSGLLLLPLMGGLMVTSALTGQLMTRFGHYKIFPVIGTATGAVGFWLLHTMGPGTTHLESTAYMIVTGLGLGFVMPVLTVAIQNVVDRKHLGIATTSQTFTRSLGSAIGVAILGAILTNELTNRVTDTFGAAAAQMGSGTDSISPQAIQSLPPAIQAQMQTILANSLDVVFLTGAAVLAAAFLVSLTLPSIKLGETAHVQVGPEGGAVPTGEGPSSGEPVSTADGGTEAMEWTDVDADSTDAAAGAGVTATDGPTERPPIGERTIAPRFAEPGQHVAVTVALPAAGGRVVLHETPPADVEIESVAPEPVTAVATRSGVYVLWEATADERPTVTYGFDVPETLTTEDELTFEGRAETDATSRTVGGTATVPVVEDFFERLLAQDAVVEQDLALAADRLADGELSARQFEVVARRWLEDGDDLEN